MNTPALSFRRLEKTATWVGKMGESEEGSSLRRLVSLPTSSLNGVPRNGPEHQGETSCGSKRALGSDRPVCERDLPLTRGLGKYINISKPPFVHLHRDVVRTTCEDAGKAPGPGQTQSQSEHLINVIS